MSAKIIVVHIITRLELGGAQQNTLYTVSHLDRDKFIPVLITGSEGILVEDARQVPDLRTFFLPALVREIAPAKDFKTLLKIRRILRGLKQEWKGNPVIVHTHSSKAGILGRWAGYFAGADIVMHSVHGFGFHPFQRSISRTLFVLAERLTSLVSDHFIVVSEANRETGIRYKLFDSENSTLIRSGISIARFRDCSADVRQLRSSLGIEEKAPLAGMIACFKPQKAPLDFVRVAAMVREKVPEARFMLVGDGELRKEIEHLSREKGLEGALVLTGWRRDMPELLKTMDMLVLTSRWEGLPRVFPQALAAGRPIVASRVDGAPEAVQDGVNGFLLKPGDLKGFAEKITLLMEDAKLRQEMGSRANEHLSAFDIGRMVADQEKLYRKLLEEKFTGQK